MSREPNDVPIEATAEKGEVILDGPDGLATSMTPRAARATAEALGAAADAAERQVAHDQPA